MQWLWCAQAGDTLQAKLLVVCGDAAAAVANNVGAHSPWGRGRIAVIPKAADGQVNQASDTSFSPWNKYFTPPPARAG